MLTDNETYLIYLIYHIEDIKYAMHQQFQKNKILFERSRDSHLDYRLRFCPFLENH